MVSLLKQSNLFFSDAKIAPTNPIHNVKCWTITWEAVKDLKGKSRKILSIVGRIAIPKKIVTAATANVLFIILLINFVE